jgi:hypothetical protein
MKGRREIDNGSEVELPWGVRIRTHSNVLVAIIVVVVMVGFLAWQHLLLADNQLKLESAMNEMVFVTSLTPEERAKLDIAMPDSLRKKLRDNQR